ncbi:13171_t:CDS:1, partial [Rhizophagus irregularis]
ISEKADHFGNNTTRKQKTKCATCLCNMKSSGKFHWDKFKNFDQGEIHQR